MERELEVDHACDIEFQRVHRIGAKKPGSPRPIIARFLRFPDRERVFRRALELKDEIDIKVYADYPKEIQDRRRKLWLRLKRAREDGRRAFFDRKEADKLFIYGHLVTRDTYFNQSSIFFPFFLFFLFSLVFFMLIKKFAS